MFFRLRQHNCFCQQYPEYKRDVCTMPWWSSKGGKEACSRLVKPKVSYRVEGNWYQIGRSTLTSAPFFGWLQIYSFHITLRNNGPVESITVKYGRIQLCAYRCKWSRTRTRKGWWGADPIESFDIPVGSVLLSHSEYDRRGSRRRWHCYSGKYLLNLGKSTRSRSKYNPP